ncbi:MAG TPA: SprT-like domain-containing protein [Thermoanaerobaculia bacterium]|nr:SprT-like domain-containing protein [Thermoanaerobaculia bacterium]
MKTVPILPNLDPQPSDDSGLATATDSQLTNWTDERLRREFERFRDQYWPGKLRKYSVKMGVLDGDLSDSMGVCECRLHLITIDPVKHSSDSELLSTLLHEMAHAAAGPKGTGHGSPFLDQLEYLLQAGAPITMGFPETGNKPDLASVPEKFVLCREALKPAYDHRREALEEYRKDRPTEDQTWESVVESFYERALEGRKWSPEAVGDRFGLLDVDDKPLPKLIELLPAARRAHRRGLRDLRRERRLRLTSVTFSCAGCHGSTLVVTVVITTTISSIKILPCTHNPNSIAAVHFTVIRERQRFSGPLDSDLRVRRKSGIETDQEFEHNTLAVPCEPCLNHSSDEEWMEKVRMENIEDPTFRVTCSDCQREIPFGWSDGPRLGRIVPIESSASDLTMFLDPRFSEQHAGNTGGAR